MVCAHILNCFAHRFYSESLAFFVIARRGLNTKLGLAGVKRKGGETEIERTKVYISYDPSTMYVRINARRIKAVKKN